MYMIGSRRRRLIARLLVAAALFAQAAFVFAACDVRDPVRAIAQSGQPCHEPKINVSLCVSHCQASDQSLDRPAFHVQALPIGAVFVLDHALPRVALSRSNRETARPNASPPPRILYHQFLI